MAASPLVHSYPSEPGDDADHTRPGFPQDSPFPRTRRHLGRGPIGGRKADFALRRAFFHDPLRCIPFSIAHEATDKRLLNGADFDLENSQTLLDGKLQCR